MATRRRAIGAGQARVELERWEDDIEVAVFRVLDDGLAADFPTGAAVFARASDYPERLDTLVIQWAGAPYHQYVVQPVGGPNLAGLNLQLAPAGWRSLTEVQRDSAMFVEAGKHIIDEAVAAAPTPEARRRVVAAIETALARAMAPSNVD